MDLDDEDGGGAGNDSLNFSGSSDDETPAVAAPKKPVSREKQELILDSDEEQGYITPPEEDEGLVFHTEDDFKIVFSDGEEYVGNDSDDSNADGSSGGESDRDDKGDRMAKYFQRRYYQ